MAIRETRGGGAVARCTGLVSIYSQATLPHVALLCRCSRSYVCESTVCICLAMELGSHCEAEFPHQALHGLPREIDGCDSRWLSILHVHGV